MTIIHTVGSTFDQVYSMYFVGMLKVNNTYSIILFVQQLFRKCITVVS